MAWFATVRSCPCGCGNTLHVEFQGVHDPKGTDPLFAVCPTTGKPSGLAPADLAWSSSRVPGKTYIPAAWPTFSLAIAVPNGTEAAFERHLGRALRGDDFGGPAICPPQLAKLPTGGFATTITVAAKSISALKNALLREFEGEITFP